MYIVQFATILFEHNTTPRIPGKPGNEPKIDLFSDERQACTLQIGGSGEDLSVIVHQRVVLYIHII